MKLKTARRRTPPLKNLFETAVWRTLKAMLSKKGYRLSYETRKFPYVLRRTYTPDFVLEKPGGRVTYIEAKGYLRPSDRAKLLAVVRDNDIDLRILFKQDHTLSKGSRNRYSDWAKKHNIPFAVGEVPKDWLK